MKNDLWKTFAAQEVSHSVAHYLTAMADLHADLGYARVSDVARQLRVTKGSVSIQVKHLKKKGYVTEDPNRFLQLTALGQTVVDDVRHNRQALIQFLARVLGVSPARAEEDACKMEHLLSPETGRQILALVDLLRSDDPDARRFVRKFKKFKAESKRAGRARRNSAR
jgi:DtxR family Mn-dependent transcriptional regulator